MRWRTIQRICNNFNIFNMIRYFGAFEIILFLPVICFAMEKADFGTAGEFVDVPAGCFQREVNFSIPEASTVKKDVCLKGLKIGKYEVTRGQWNQVMGSSLSWNDKCGDNCPATMVSWNDAQQFIRKLNSLTNRHYRLPTESEWEFACRTAGKDQKYCGDTRVEDMAWHVGNSSGTVHPVGRKQPNGLGIYDMSGNAAELVAADETFKSYTKTETTYSLICAQKQIVRGGGWKLPAEEAVADASLCVAADERREFVGFRLIQAE